jgi:hypothetical protein
MSYASSAATSGETLDECDGELAGPYECPVYPPAEPRGGGPHLTGRYWPEVVDPNPAIESQHSVKCCDHGTNVGPVVQAGGRHDHIHRPAG